MQEEAMSGKQPKNTKPTSDVQNTKADKGKDELNEKKLDQVTGGHGGGGGTGKVR
jgi:bacteriocin-like protein